MLKKGNEIPTIDVSLVTVSNDGNATEIALDTSTKVAVTPQITTTDAITLVIKNILRAQKPKKSVITGHTIVLTDNVLNPELLKMLQGGTITYKSGDSGPITKYEPPLAGEAGGGEEFTLNLYSAVYDAAGTIVNYEKTTYPHCYGDPIAPSSEDGVFRIMEYTINSAPSKGEAPYTIEYVDDLPEVS